MAARAAAGRRAYRGRVPTYHRPPIAAELFRDADGAVIPYGHRWPQGPREDAYSVTRHPERFQPLHTVAEALIDWLAASYLVRVEDNPSTASDLSILVDSVVRAVRLTPAGGAAGLTIAFTAFPGVLVHAGDSRDIRYPVCGCDACDESWENLADHLETLVRTVVAGYSEVIATEPPAQPGDAGSTDRTLAESITRLFDAGRSAPAQASPVIRWPAWPPRPARPTGEPDPP
jgi:hypothetical protein